MFLSEYKNVMTKPKVDIVFFIGMSGSGKDTVARKYAELYGHKKIIVVKYADKLKEYVYSLVYGVNFSPEQIEALTEEQKERVRPILITLAKEVQTITADFTTRDMRWKLLNLIEIAEEDTTVIVTDMRTNLEFNEALSLKNDWDTLSSNVNIDFIYIERKLFEHELARQVVGIFGINKFSGFLISLFSKSHSVRIELEAASLALRGIHTVVNKEGNPQITAENVRTILSQKYHTKLFEKSEQRKKLDSRWIKFDL